MSTNARLASSWFSLRVFSTVIALSSFLAVVIFMESTVIVAPEMKALNYLQRARYWMHGPIFDTQNLTLIAIDDQSVDPTYSPFSDPWGQGNWQTRGNYSLQLSILSLEIKIRPAVLAYDILFLPVEAPQIDTETQKRLTWLQQLRGVNLDQNAAILKKLSEVQLEGNQSIQNELFTIKDLREAGENAPYPVFAYTFTADARGLKNQRISPEEKQKMFETLRAEIIPEGLVQGGSTLYKTINPPASEIITGTDVGLGSINVLQDQDGIVQKVPLLYAVLDPVSGKTQYVCGLALRSLFAFWGIRIQDLKPVGSGFPSLQATAGKEVTIQTKEWVRRIPVDHDFKLLLNTRGRYRDVNALPFVDVTRYGLEMIQAVQDLKSGQNPNAAVTDRAQNISAQLKGKIALVAQASTGGGDIGNYAVDRNVPNAMAHLYVMDNILRDDTLREPSIFLKCLICGLIALASFFLYARGKVLSASSLLTLLFLIYPLTAILVMDHTGQVLPLLGPLLLAVILLIANTTYHYLNEVKQKRWISRMFSTMVSPKILDLMKDHPEAFSLKGKKMEATIFFSDLAGFTSISEKLSAEQLSALMNRYLTPMTDLILAADGSLDKYSGDGIMAVWGVPYPDPDHALKACRSALKQQERLLILAAEIRQELGIEISVRMGINSGQVSAGNMGSQTRFQYTVMGDAVNLAARLEPLGKFYDAKIILGQETQKLINPSLFILRCLDKIVVKGKSEPVLIYELVGESLELGKIPDWVQHYETALDHLWKRDWNGAKKFFLSSLNLREDVASRMMLARVDFYLLNPPEESWNGAYIRETKD